MRISKVHAVECIKSFEGVFKGGLTWKSEIYQMRFVSWFLGRHRKCTCECDQPRSVVGAPTVRSSIEKGLENGPSFLYSHLLHCDWALL